LINALGDKSVGRPSKRDNAGPQTTDAPLLLPLFAVVAAAGVEMVEVVLVVLVVVGCNTCNRRHVASFM
jgi:hypothetical protein